MTRSVRFIIAIGLLAVALPTAPALAGRVLSRLDRCTPSVTPDLNFNGLDHVSLRFGEFWSEESRSATAVRLQ